MTQKSKEQYLDAFRFNPINSYRLPKQLIYEKTNNNEKDIDTHGNNNKQIRERKHKSLKQKLVDGFDEMVEKNRTGMRVQVLRSAIEGWGVYAKQYIKYVFKF
jgi:hypothetical protein